MVPIDFDKHRTLKFDLRAIKDLEANMGGMPLGSIIQQWTQVGVTALTVGLWAGLKHEDKGLSIALVTKMLQTYINDRKPLRQLGRALNDAIEETGLFRSDADEQEESDPNGQTATTDQA